jgi:predicted O-linked N-acetylglucosamine transferase (SPINDLY family)
MAGSLLHSVGLDHLICTNEIEYEQKAIALGLERDRKTVKEARKHLENLKVRGELFNTESFARDFEDKLVKLLEDPSGSSTRANGLAVRTR